MTYAVTAVYVGVASAALTAYAGYAQAQTSKKVARHNAEVAEIGAADALARGEKAAIDARHKGQAILGAQRTALSSRGLALDEGTPADLLSQSEFFTLGDEATTRNNSKKEAWARSAQATGFDLQADGVNPGLQLAGSLLSSGSSVAAKWYQPKTGS